LTRRPIQNRQRQHVPPGRPTMAPCVIASAVIATGSRSKNRQSSPEPTVTIGHQLPDRPLGPACVGRGRPGTDCRPRVGPQAVMLTEGPVASARQNRTRVAEPDGPVLIGAIPTASGRGSQSTPRSPESFSDFSRSAQVAHPGTGRGVACLRNAMAETTEQVEADCCGERTAVGQSGGDGLAPGFLSHQIF